jgi:hypothetical protein
MAGGRMTVGAIAKQLQDLSDRMGESFAQVDGRFAQMDARFEQVDARFEQQSRQFHTDLEEFAEQIKNAFKVSLEGMEAKLDAALDVTREQARRLGVLERVNADEHRLMQAQIQELDAELQSHRRRGRRRPS